MHKPTRAVAGQAGWPHSAGLRLAVWLGLLVLLGGCRSSPTTPASTPAPSPDLPAPPAATLTPTGTPAPPAKFGLHLLLDDGRHAWPPALWRDHLAAARALVGDWGYVTELVRLDDLDPQRWQAFMDLCTELHLTPLLRLATTYDTQAG